MPATNLELRPLIDTDENEPQTFTLIVPEDERNLSGYAITGTESQINSFIRVRTISAFGSLTAGIFLTSIAIFLQYAEAQLTRKPHHRHSDIPVLVLGILALVLFYKAYQERGFITSCCSSFFNYNPSNNELTNTGIRIIAHPPRSR